MRGPRAVAALLVLMGLAGCIADEPTEETQDPDIPVTIYEDEDISVQDLAVVEWEPNLLESPPWRVGEWWLVEMTDVFTGETTTFYRVVAGFDNATNSYLVGMPTHGFSNLIMVLHIPGFGQIDKDTLGYELHDFKMDPLQFPLEDGASWSTFFETCGVVTTVSVLNETQAEVLFQDDPDVPGGCRSGRYVYDATIHAISEFQVNGYGTYEVVDHGYDFHEVGGWDGQVTVPYQHDLIFQHGCLAGGVSATPAQFSSGPSDPTGSSPASPCMPSETQVVAEGYDRVSFAIILGDVSFILNAPAGGGASQETATAPDGTVFEETATAGEFKTVPYKHDAPVGEWTFQHVSSGTHIALSEGIAYKVFDIQLPIGEVIETAGEHEHEDPSAGH